MATVDWSQCPAVVSIPGKVSGAWVFKDTRMPVSTVFENFEAGATIDETMEWFDVTREQIIAVLEFAARSLDAPARDSQSLVPADAHSLGPRCARAVNSLSRGPQRDQGKSRRLGQAD
jgi:uncharacterized protein (DUF433 family)